MPRFPKSDDVIFEQPLTIIKYATHYPHLHLNLMAAPLLPLTGTLLPRGSFGNGLHEPGAAHTLEDHIVTTCNILCAHLGGKYFLSHNFKTINMIVDIQHLQNQQLHQQIAKLANNLGQLHHRQINKGNKQANNEEKQRNKQTTIAKNTHWHLHRGPTAFSALDTPTADQLEISRFFYFLVLIV